MMIVAGEASADAHAAAMVRELLKLRPGLDVFGVGGKQLEAAGAELLFDFSGVGVVGFTEVLPELGRFYRAYRSLLKAVRERRPRGVVLVDLPDFNLMLARKIKRIRPETRIIYYICPQVWAWRRGRIKKIARRIDAMLAIFPFEVEIYEKAGMDVEFVGHPLKDVVTPSADRDALRGEFGIGADEFAIALAPGSRKAEIERYLPVMAETAAALSKERGLKKFILARAPTLSRELIEDNLGPARGLDKVIEGRAWDMFHASDLAIAASGTVTLEAALIGTPAIALGAASRITFLLAKSSALVDNFSLPNIILGREVIPELLQDEVRTDRILEIIRDWLDHPEKLDTIRDELVAVGEALGQGGASRRAARAVYRRLFE